MSNFKDFNIKPKVTNFVGDKIKIDRILNREILVTNYKILPSTKKENTMFLTLEFKVSGNNHILFSGSTILMQMIEDVHKSNFPFTTTIVRENEHFEFTWYENIHNYPIKSILKKPSTGWRSYRFFPNPKKKNTMNGIIIHFTKFRY